MKLINKLAVVVILSMGLSMISCGKKVYNDSIPELLCGVWEEPEIGTQIVYSPKKTGTITTVHDGVLSTESFIYAYSDDDHTIRMKIEVLEYNEKGEIKSTYRTKYFTIRELTDEEFRFYYFITDSEGESHMMEAVMKRKF